MELFKHQIKALQWSANHNHFPCFMEMRTGKSLVALQKIKTWGGKTLLVAPLSTWFDWLKLFKQENIDAVALSGTTKHKQIWMEVHYCWVDVVLINPEGLTAWGKEFFDYDFNNCLLDESVFIKNPKSKISKLLMKHKKLFYHRMVMTGTPIAETTEDVVNQMIWCLGEFMEQDNFYKWRARYMQPAKFGWSLKRGVRNALRQALKAESFVLSAKDAGMFAEQIRKVYLVELPKEMQEDYREIQKAWMLDCISTKYGVVKDTWLSQLSCGIYPMDLEGVRRESYCFKVKAIQQLLDGELKGQQVVVFSRWRKETSAIAKYLKCDLITGDTLFEDRDTLLNQFRRGDFQYLVIQTKCACRGLDLSCVNTAIMCSNYWQYEIRAQIMARMKHPLKKIPTLFIDIITKDTIEERVYEVLHEKGSDARFFLQRVKAKVKARA